MDRNREAKRAAIAATNGLSRRRNRTSSLRDSPEEDGLLELQETGRLRDRKKDRDRERERERDRERDRDRDRLNRSKRRRGDRSMHGNSNREDGGDNSSEESVNDEEEDDDGAGDRVGGGSGSMRMLPPTNPMFSSSSLLNQRKSFPPATKNIRAGPTWKATADEMIGVSVPRKARSASTKRSHEWPSSPGIIADSIYRQASTSPVRPGPTTTAASSSPAPVSPSGSNVSVKKKLKPSGPKLRPPKTTSKSSSPAQDEIEIEIAEVLYGMMRQPQGPTKQEILVTDSIKFEAKEEMKSSNDGKSIVSSPISNTQSTITLPSAILPQNSSSTVTPMSAIAPKRKRPRPVKYEDENPSVLTHQNSPISSTSKVGTDQSTKTVTCSPILKKELGSAAENGVSYGLGQLHVSLPASTTEPQKEIIKQIENIVVSQTKSVTEKMENRDLDASIEEPQSPKKESIIAKLDDNREDLTVTKDNSTSSEVENQLEDKFQIDLMARPRRSSPERDSEAVEAKLMVTDAETDKPLIKETKIGKNGEQKVANVEPEKANPTVEEIELKKSYIGNNDLQFDLEKPDNRDSSNTLCVNKLQEFVAKQPQQQANSEKSAQSNSLPLPMSMAGWPGGIPPFGYMAPLQGPVAVDGSTVSSAAAIQPPPYLFSQPRPKRCATHCYIARNICCHQQILKMNSFWPAAAAGCGSLYGAKHLPSAELHANISARGVNSGPDKGQGPAIFSAHLGTDKGAQTANIVDATQRKQLLLPQTLPPGAPSNILHGPAFIFPLGQQQAAAAAACVRPGSVKSPTPGCASSSTSNPTSAIAQVTAAAAPAMSFNYPNLPGNETQYLVLPNNAYPFPIPAHVGAPPAYRGAHAQAMPFFNGSFYSSQMLHPSHLQQQQQQPSSYSQQNQQGLQNTSISSCSTSSQKHQQRSHAGGTGNLQAFPSPKNHSMQQMQMQARQQQQNQPAPHQARQLESEMGSEDSPSTADSRVTRGGMSIYGHNFAMPMHAPNFALMTPASFNGTSGTSVASGNNNIEKQQLQQQGSKDRVEASQAFAMSFASINGSTTTPGFDIASIAQHPAILQNVPDVRQGYHFMAAAAVAQTAQHRKTNSVPEERKNGGDSSNGDEERKTTAGKDSAVGQSIAFTRPDLSDAAGSTIPGNTVIDISARSLNLGSATARASGSVTSATISGVNASNTQQQMQRNHHQQQMPRNQQQQNQQPQLSMQQNQQPQLSMQQNQQQQLSMQQNQQQMQRYQQQMIHVQKQQHQHAAVARSKAPATSNGSVYNDHLRPSSMSAKFPNAVSSFSQNLNQSSSSPVQSPQWKNSPRSTPPSQTPPSMASSTSSSLKSLPQQGRLQQGHTQISFAANPKSSTQGQGVQPASSHQPPSPPVMVGSPTTSSVSKGGGSPRTTTSTSTGNKTSQASLSSQQAKNSSASSLKSSPVGGRNVPSILGNPHTSSSLSTVAKPQQQQQLSKSMQQAQLYFSNAYMHSPAPQSNNNTTSAATSSGYYHQRRRPEQQQSQSSSSGMLSLCTPVTLPNNSTSDPAKAAAAAMKGGLHSQTLIQPAQFAAAQSGSAHQLIPAGFSYVHAVPTAVQVKPAEQKQPAGE